MPLGESLSVYWQRLQGELFPALSEELGPLGERHRQLVTVLELARPEGFIGHAHGARGRPRHDRAALARGFIAKAVFNIVETEALVERLKLDKTVRRLCGWSWAGSLPSTATFSRAFAEFAAQGLAMRLHEAVILTTQSERLIGHIARDATAIEAREQTARKKPAPPRPKRKRGRPKKGEERPKPPQERRRLERQGEMSLAEMLADLPRACSPGVKQNAKGYRTHWIGYKLHLDVADGDIPISAILTSASLHDSQAAIPLATMTASRVTNLYDLMDNAYDAPEIKAHSRALGHVPLIEPHPRTAAGKERIRAEARRRKLSGLSPGRTCPLSGAKRRRTRLRQLQGQLRRPHDPRTRPRQARLPRHVRASRAQRHPDHASRPVATKAPRPASHNSRKKPRRTKPPCRNNASPGPKASRGTGTPRPETRTKQPHHDPKKTAIPAQQFCKQLSISFTAQDIRGRIVWRVEIVYCPCFTGNSILSLFYPVLLGQGAACSARARAAMPASISGSETAA